LVDAGGTVDIRVFPTEAEQAAAMVPGMRRLLRLAVPSPVKTLERALDPRARLMLGANPDGSLAALLDDCADAATDRLVPAPVWTRAEFTALRDLLARQLVPTTQATLGQVEKVLAAAHGVDLALPTTPPPTQADAIADIRNQLDRLMPKGFVTAAGAGRLVDLARYLTAINRRLDRLPHSVAADRERMQRVHDVQDALDDLVGALSPTRAAADDIRDIARQIEELRVSLWAQQLGTARPVSEKRIYRAIDAIRP
jgi:ATP-dependent helicase HrpA